MTDLFNELYNKKLIYNCCFKVLKRTDKSDLLLIYLGTSEFIIVNNYCGVVAYGTRKYNFDTNELFISYENKKDSFVNCSTIEKILTKHEREDMKIKSVIHFKRILNNEKN